MPGFNGMTATPITASNAQDARNTLDVYSKSEAESAITNKILYFGSDSWENVYDQLSVIPVRQARLFCSYGNTSKFITGKESVGNTNIIGVVTKDSGTAGTYTFGGIANGGAKIISWSITGFTSRTSVPTFRTVYQYTGTAVT